jgi:hypothetical protein
MLNVEVEEDKQPGRTEFYYSFKGWKHGIVAKENEISFEGKKISVPYARWSANELQELGKVLHNAAIEMVRADK